MDDRRPEPVASLRVDQGRLQEAEPLFEELTQRITPSNVTAALAAAYVARYSLCLLDLKKYDKAEPQLTDALARLRAVGLPNSPTARKVIAGLIQVYERTDRPADADKWREELARLPATQPAASTSQPTTAPAGR